MAQSFTGGGTIQNATTTPTANIGSLGIDNSSGTGVTLNLPISLSSSLTLASGILNTSTANLLTVGYNATNTGTITRTAGIVNGPLKKWYAAGTGSATFPVGAAGNYKPATINFTTAPSTAGTLTASFSAVAPDFPNAAPLTEGSLIINRASTQGTWLVEAGDGLAGGIYTASFTGNGATDVIDYTKTVLIKRPSAGGDWVLDGTHVTTTGSNTAPVVSRTAMSGFSQFAIGGENNVALPISIEYFRGSKQNGAHLLDWKVACYSSPTLNMQLERSADGRRFQTISSQTETSLRCLQPFNYSDAAPLAGINYYRLKSIDADGKVSYSTIVALLNKEIGFEMVSLVPNPVRSEATLSITSATKSIMELVVTDVNGKQLNKQRVSLIAGNNLLPISVSNLAAGTYQVTG
ncbi:MAG: T9SS type A sorting domain-containing protein, partial [Sphingobacteriales bacterium]